MPIDIINIQYQQKLSSPEEAVKVVKSGDIVFYGEFVMFAETLDAALSKRIQDLNNVLLRGTCLAKMPQAVLADPYRQHVIYEDWHFGGATRKLHDKNIASYIPFSYHHGPRLIHKYCDYDIAFVMVAPMDENGFFNLGVVNSLTQACCNKSKKIVVEVNKNIPICLGGNSESIHISEVDYIIEGNNTPLIQVPPAKPSDLDYQIAEYVMNEIEDGSCLQLGIGGLPNVIGSLIADSDLKDLGFHSEMLVDSCVDMYKAGRITGLRKTIDKRKIVYTFAMGTNKLYEFLDNNPMCATYPVSYTNDPRIIALNNKVIAINNALEVDLFSQVASESNGSRHISGTGGQLDFISGAFHSSGGKGLICLSSTYTDKEGNLHSRIRPTLGEGTIVTVPRSMVQYIVTEYGIVQLKGKSTWQRAEALINIAHPKFRDELIKSADKMNIWLRTKKQDAV